MVDYPKPDFLTDAEFDRILSDSAARIKFYPLKERREETCTLDSLPKEATVDTLQQTPKDGPLAKAVKGKFAPNETRRVVRHIPPSFKESLDSMKETVARGMMLDSRLLTRAFDTVLISKSVFFDESHHMKDHKYTFPRFDKREEEQKQSSPVSRKADKYIVSYQSQPTDESFLRQASREIWASVLPKEEKT